HRQLQGLPVGDGKRSLSLCRQRAGGDQQGKAPASSHFFVASALGISNGASLVSVLPSNWNEHSARYFPAGSSPGYSAENSRRSPGNSRSGSKVAFPTSEPLEFSTAAAPSGNTGSVPMLEIHCAIFMFAVSLAGITRTGSGFSFTSLVRLKVISAPSDAVMPTAPEEVGNLSVPRNMATTARIFVSAGSVSRTSTAAEENGFTSTVFCENTAEAAMLFGVSPAATKMRLPSFTTTSSATISKAKSRAV